MSKKRTALFDEINVTKGFNLNVEISDFCLMFSYRNVCILLKSSDYSSNTSTIAAKCEDQQIIFNLIKNNSTFQIYDRNLFPVSILIVMSFSSENR
jgi:hypothetical protein